MGCPVTVDDASPIRSLEQAKQEALGSPASELTVHSEALYEMMRCALLHTPCDTRHIRNPPVLRRAPSRDSGAASFASGMVLGSLL